MAARLFLIDEQALTQVVEVALGNPIRTTDQQAALVAACQQLDNPLVDWSHQAGDTWEGNRCNCGRAIPVMSDRCGDCARAEATS